MMTQAEIELLQSIGKIPPQAVKFTITQATDWPMFLTMIKVVGIVATGAYGTIVALLLYIYRSLLRRIGHQRAEDNSNCTSCKKAIWEHIGGPVWSAIESCCPRLSETEKMRLKDEIKRQTGAEAHAQ